MIESHGLEIVDPQEFELFKYLTKYGKFYDYLMNDEKISDKKLIKECVYKVFFGRNYPNKYDKLFENKFPTIYTFIKYYKKTNGGYKILSYDLQNLESNFVFNKVVKEIFHTDPNIHLITVHDSIICSKKYRSVVEQIFNNLLSFEFDSKATIHIDPQINIYSYA